MLDKTYELACDLMVEDNGANRSYKSTLDTRNRRSHTNKLCRNSWKSGRPFDETLWYSKNESPSPNNIAEPPALKKKYP